MKNRRSFIKFGLASLAVLPFLVRESFAKDACKGAKLEAGKNAIDDKTAKRLAYVEDATTSKHKKYKAGSNCDNCNFYKPKKGEDCYARCSMAGNKYVAKAGWCKTYKENKKKKS